MSIPYKLNDLETFALWGKPEEPLFCDTETCILYGQIRLVQVFQRGWPQVLVFDISSIPLREVLQLLKHYNVIFHNAAYDITCFMEDLHLKVNPFERFDDSLLLARIAFVDKDAFSLDACLSYVHGYDIYEEFGDKKTMQRSFLSTKKRDGMTAELTETQIQYACADVYYFGELWDILAPYKETPHYKVDIEFLNNSLAWQFNGMPVDEGIRKNTKIELEEQLKGVTAQLPEGLNVNSYLQVRQFLGVNASAKNDLLEIEKSGNPSAGLVLQKRKILKLLNFVDRFGFMRLRGYFAPTTISGRVRCDGGDIEGTDNLLQIPRKLKNVFGFSNISPNYLVYCDYSQLELRTACCNTNEKNIEKTFREGRDLHANTAALMFEGLSYEEALTDKVKRHAAKTCNFSLLYCGSANSLRGAFLKDGGQLIPLTQAADYLSKWKKSYPAFAEWHKNAALCYQRGDMVRTTKNGRRYKAKLFTDICGIENQSLGADAAKLALNLLVRKQPDVKVLCFIHDAIILEAPNAEEGRRLGQLLGECMLEAWFEAIKNLPINDLPMPLEVNMGKNLGTIETEGEVVYKTDGLQALKFEEKKLNDTLGEWEPPEELLHRDVLLDADTPFWLASLKAESFDEALYNIEEYFKFLRGKLQPKSLKVFLTIGKCFRYNLYPEYKANRAKAPRPEHLQALKEYCAKEFSNVVYNTAFEADDLLVEAKLNNPEALVVTIDKDILYGLPGRHLNPMKREIIEVSKRSARLWPFIQALAGDSTDNIPGIPGIGIKKATAIMEKHRRDSEAFMWKAVVRAFEERGLTFDDALLSMRLVNMRQCIGGKLELFNPANLKKY